MSRCSLGTSIIRAAVMTAVATAFPAAAAPSTSQGLVSVAQVVRMLDEASADRTAHQILTAYLAGTGEAASSVLHLSGASCKATPSLSATDVRHAVGVAAASSDPAETPATPLIVRDMLDRAGCRVR